MPVAPVIVYLHGFISSPQSKKAVMLGDYVKNCVTGIEYLVPALHHRPKRAVAQIEEACGALPSAASLSGDKGSSATA